MQGIFIHGSRPKSKKEVREVVEQAQKSAVEKAAIRRHPSNQPEKGGYKHIHDLYCVVVEATSYFGSEYDGSLSGAERRIKNKEFMFSLPIFFVGLDPYTNRKFYGTIEYKKDKTGKQKWIVK